MQISPLFFKPSLFQNSQPVGAKANLTVTPLTASKRDEFTPLAKQRQGNAEESLEQQFVRVASTMVKHSEEEKDPLKPLREVLSGIEEDIKTSKFLDVNFFRDDEKF